ncbi:MAG: YciI family protein [Cyclobacteriaceae bacterium]
MKNVLILLLFLTTTARAQDKVFVFLHHRADKAELPKPKLDSIMKGHFANIEKMANEGKLVVAGPFEGGGGIFIFNANSISQVKDWLKNDPGIQSNRWNVEMLPFKVRTGRPQLVKEPLQMVNYQFVRFKAYVAKFNINDIPELLKKHDDYLSEIKKSGNVIAEGIFGDNDGGILIMKGELDRKVIELDPAVREGLLEIEIKKWFVAKGAFSEQ